MTDILTETDRHYRTEMNVGGKKSVENLKGTTPITDYDRSEITGKCETFQLFGQHENK
jgi:hypothetical protein